MKLRQFIERTLWDRIKPGKRPPLWIGTKVLLLDHDLLVEHYRRGSIRELVYGAYHSISFTETEHNPPSVVDPGTEEQWYLNNWNSSRQDMTAEYVQPPHQDAQLVDVQVDTKPGGDLSLWLCHRLLGFTMQELSFMTLTEVDLQEPRRGLVPILKGAHETLRRMRIRDPLVNAWNRQRYLLVRYYLDAIYHELPK